ncbi:ribosome-associated translation inhibitor RaiA [Anaerolineales bacterium HSG6]|nr:ribosome-associated translation inhibitor RaiA [Anaerolineales bacterium HSG6]MDM8530364.1 ribosome-associated translation inhibitor RaiA [Anaerolineales bacterium HSG25]
MQLLLKGKNFVISDRIREYSEKKVSKLDRYLPDIGDIQLEITQEKHSKKNKGGKTRNIVQMTVFSNGTILRAEDRSDGVYTSIDAVVEKIHRQIARFKGKRDNRWKGQKNYRDMQEGMPELAEEVWEELAEEQERTIVRVKRFPVSPMSTEEAIEQMELLDHDFFVFYNPDTGQINVLYRRTDGDYGLIDPELS